MQLKKCWVSPNLPTLLQNKNMNYRRASRLGILAQQIILTSHHIRSFYPFSILDNIQIVFEFEANFHKPTGKKDNFLKLEEVDKI